MRNRKYEKITTDKIMVKGVLSDDCSTITFENDKKESEEVLIAKCLKPFAGKEIVFSLNNKDTQDMDEEFNAED